MNPRRSRPVLIGVGNPWRGDGAVGVAAAMGAAPRLGTYVDVATSDGEPGRLVDLWDGRPLAVVVNAVRSGAAPGTAHALEVAGDRHLDALAADAERTAHLGGVAAAVRLGQSARRLPQRLFVLGVEAHGFDPTEAMVLSPRVSAALPGVIDQIVTVLAPLAWQAG